MISYFQGRWSFVFPVFVDSLIRGILIIDRLFVDFSELTTHTDYFISSLRERQTEKSITLSEKEEVK